MKVYGISKVSNELLCSDLCFFQLPVDYIQQTFDKNSIFHIYFCVFHCQYHGQKTKDYKQ